uniref:Uncharacterized protein n=1 Tax=Timema douglasi TaxID=61478 RepID=A0A7R8VRZ7_TIMDO|nr:unnamed protein product [Timema douglasi]
MPSHRAKISHQPTISFVQTAEKCKLPARPPCLSEKMSEMKESWWRTSKNTGMVRFRAWEYFKDFSSNTTIHGIKYLGEENRHVLEK